MAVWCLESQPKKAYQEGGNGQPDQTAHGQVGRRLITLGLAAYGFWWLQPELFSPKLTPVGVEADGSALKTH